MGFAIKPMESSPTRNARGNPGLDGKEIAMFVIVRVAAAGGSGLGGAPAPVAAHDRGALRRTSTWDRTVILSAFVRWHPSGTVPGMVDAFDVRVELTGIGDRASAWRFIERFAAAWAAPITAADGWDDAALDEAQARLGVAFPAAVREAYRLFGRRDDLTRTQDELLEPKQLYVQDGMLVFRDEDEGAACWGVETSGADPRVMIRADLDDEEAGRWEPWLDRFSLACVEIVLSESLHADAELADYRETDEDDLEVLERYTSLPIPEYPAGELPGTRWFAGPDVILREDQRAWLTVRARTAGALTAVCDDFGDGWLA